MTDINKGSELNQYQTDFDCIHQHGQDCYYPGMANGSLCIYIQSKGWCKRHGKSVP